MQGWRLSYTKPTVLMATILLRQIDRMPVPPGMSEEDTLQEDGKDRRGLSPLLLLATFGSSIILVCCTLQIHYYRVSHTC